MSDDDAAEKAAANAAPNAAAKKVIGRPFPKGRSANPAGKKRGTKHRKTLWLAAMSDDDRAAIVAKIIRQARRGCRASQKLIVDRTEPSRRGSPVKFPLPPIVTVADVVTAQAAITAAMAAGQLTPSEAQEVSAVVELARRAIETNQLEERLRAIETKMGDDATKSFKERLEAIERRIRAKPGAGTFVILEVLGCLPGPINFAYAGLHRWERTDGEDFDAFVRRSADAALEAGEMAMNVGGLPRGDEYAKFRTADGFDFEAWWATVAPYYPEVPDPEPEGYRHPRQCSGPSIGCTERRAVDR